MIERPPLQDDDSAWRAHWIAEIQRRARVEVPQLLRSIRRQQLQPLTDSRPATITPVTPVPETGPMERLRDTVMISAVKLLPIDVRETRELVSSAIRWFHGKYGCLPTEILLNPLRCLAIDLSFFPVNCDDLGCYTITVIADPGVSCDTVKCRVTWYEYEDDRQYRWLGIRDSYL